MEASFSFVLSTNRKKYCCKRTAQRAFFCRNVRTYRCNAWRVLWALRAEEQIRTRPSRELRAPGGNPSYIVEMNLLFLRSEGRCSRDACYDRRSIIMQFQVFFVYERRSSLQPKSSEFFQNLIHTKNERSFFLTTSLYSRHG